MHPASARTTRRRQSHASAAAAAKEDADGPEQTPARVPLVVPITDADHGSRELLRQVPGRVAAALRLGPHEVPVVKAPGREGLRVDGRDHFAGDAITTARWLLGAKLVRVLEDGRRLSGRVVEVEAYLGVGDAAAHSFRAKRTSKNDAMYKAGGTTYIYQCHRYFCMNVICGGVDEPTGVLIRALEPLEGVEQMLEHRVQRKGALGPAPTALPALTDAQRARLLQELAAGPGRMCMALGMDRELNGACLRKGASLFLEFGEHIEEHRIAASGRVGVEYARDWARAPLRFAVRDSKHVSKPWPWSVNATSDVQGSRSKGKAKAKGGKRRRGSE